VEQKGNQKTSGDEGSYQMLTVLNSGAATFQIVGLEKFTTYQVFLLPFFKNVEGRPSNYVNVTTLQDGK
jgi:roundabout axon guidance receptor 2